MKPNLGGKKRAKGQASKRDHDDDQPMGRSGSRKSMVTVATERGGRARAAKGRTHGGRTIANFVFGNVNRTGTVLVSDELPAYRWIGRKFPAHLRVNHSKGEYSRRDRHAPATAHVNTAESFNATLKRAWVGVFHWFSIKQRIAICMRRPSAGTLASRTPTPGLPACSPEPPDACAGRNLSRDGPGKPA